MHVAVALFYAKLLAKTFWWPFMTSHDLTADTAKIASRESGMVMTDVIHDRGCYYDEYLSKMT